jgi:hypothetical protein
MSTEPSKSSLQWLQRLLEQIYDLNMRVSVGDFLVTDECVIRELEGSAFRATREKLLIHENEDELLLSLYLDPDALRRLPLTAPVTDFKADRLEDLWTVLEGVSHFIYLAWNADFDRSVRGMELELQAEVDKYVVTATLDAGHSGGWIPAQLHQLLFERQTFDERLNPTELARYQNANRYAGKYCRRLTTRYQRIDHADLRRELRRFYRLPQCDKLRLIDRI